MASSVANSQAEAAPVAAPEIAHLPDASEELASTADLTVSVHGVALRLHSAVLASGSRVLRTALCSCGADDAARAAAVGRGLEEHALPDVQLFLRLLYNPKEVKGIIATDTQSWRGLLELAHKLDAQAVQWACDTHLKQLLDGPMLGDDWTEWLVLADRLHMAGLIRLCAKPVLNGLGRNPQVKQSLLALNPLSKLTMQMLFEGLLHAGRCGSGNRFTSTGWAGQPKMSGWKAPGDLF